MDRPTFERLRNTMKEMEGNHKVRRVRETIMDTEGSFREEANTVQGLKLSGVCSTPAPSRPLIPVWVTVFIFHSAWFLQKQFTLKHLSITLHALLTKLLQTACRSG